MRTLITAAILGAAAGAAQAEMARYELDPEHTTVYFNIAHIGYADTLGIFGEVSGAFDYDAETRELGAVNVEIGAESIDTFNDARDKHVRGSDFLDVSGHPEITFTADGGEPSSATSGTVTGDLTILGETRPVTLSVTLNKAARYPFGHKREVLGLSMETSIRRSEFGMTYGVANGLVGDVVDINIETEAMKVE